MSDTINSEFRRLIDEGVYPVVTLSLLEILNKIEINESNIEYLKETLESYKNYLNLIENLPLELKEAFLLTLKQNEIISNHETENEDKFMLRFYDNVKKINSIDVGMLMINEKISVKDIQVLHQVLMDGTSKIDADNYKLRTDDTHFVGSVENGKNVINYFPIRKEENYQAMQLIASYINEEVNDENMILVQPFIIHGAIAAVQSFDDGNTRLARLIQHLKIWQLSKQFNISHINIPAIYLSKSYLLTRAMYRKKINNIVIDSNNKAWNDWITYNLNMFNEQIYFGETNLGKIR